MAGDTTTSTWLSAWLECMHCNTRASRCRFACADRRYGGTSCYDMSNSMGMVHPRLHLLLVLTINCLGDRYHVLTPQIKPPQASRSICAISALLVNFRPAINPEYFSAPVPMS
ncbi:hypothetical protein Bca4012_065327 [Brassica carinata]